MPATERAQQVQEYMKTIYLEKEKYLTGNFGGEKLLREEDMNKELTQRPR